jgi:hypothetical protein
MGVQVGVHRTNEEIDAGARIRQTVKSTLTSMRVLDP